MVSEIRYLENELCAENVIKISISENKSETRKLITFNNSYCKGLIYLQGTHISASHSGLLFGARAKNATDIMQR